MSNIYLIWSYFRSLDLSLLNILMSRGLRKRILRSFKTFKTRRLRWSLDFRVRGLAEVVPTSTSLTSPYRQSRTCMRCSSWSMLVNSWRCTINRRNFYSCLETGKKLKNNCLHNHNQGSPSWKIPSPCNQRACIAKEMQAFRESLWRLEQIKNFTN